MCKLAILLTTYQSETYLTELLDSIITQTYKNWTLYIRDDSSTDNTLNIIDKYVSDYSNIVKIEDPIKRGAKDGFLWLLEKVSANYYMFCDHDDIWLPSKIETMYNALTAATSLYPLRSIVVHSDLVVVNSNLEVISKSYWEYTRLCTIVDTPSALKFCNSVTGCAMGFNDIAKTQVLSEYSRNISMHDAWVALCVLKNKGQIIPIHESLILYRQHHCNTIGAREYHLTIMEILKNWKSVFVQNYIWYKMVKQLFDLSFMDFLIGKIKIYRKKCIR